MTSREIFEKEMREEMKTYKEHFGTYDGFKVFFKRKVERVVGR